MKALLDLLAGLIHALAMMLGLAEPVDSRPRVALLTVAQAVQMGLADPDVVEAVRRIRRNPEWN